MSYADLDATKKLGLTAIKKNWKCVGQAEMALNWQLNWIFVPAIFMKNSHKVYKNKKVTENMKSRQNIDPEWVSSFFSRYIDPFKVERWTKKIL